MRLLLAPACTGYEQKLSNQVANVEALDKIGTLMNVGSIPSLSNISETLPTEQILRQPKVNYHQRIELQDQGFKLQSLAALSVAPFHPSSIFRRFLTLKPFSLRHREEQQIVCWSCCRVGRIRNNAGSDDGDGGVDFETHPMVIMNASAMSDHREVNCDLLLSRILSYLNLYGGRHTPGWNWVWKAYCSLSRKYRQNLEQLYIIHSTFFSKMLFSLAGAIISPKFFRKISYIDTLS